MLPFAFASFYISIQTIFKYFSYFNMILAFWIFYDDAHLGLWNQYDSIFQIHILINSAKTPESILMVSYPHEPAFAKSRRSSLSFLQT